MRLLQLGTTLLFALALVPGGAHLLELLNKMALDRHAYLAVQQIYRGWNLLGAVLIAALCAGLALTAMSRRQKAPFRLALAGSALLAATLGIFFIWIFPVNIATSNWTVETGNWMELRRQWEYSHALNAVITFAALACITSSCLAWNEERR